MLGDSKVALGGILQSSGCKAQIIDHVRDICEIKVDF